MQNFPQLRLGARLDLTVAQVQAVSWIEAGKESRDGGSRAVVQDVLWGHGRCWRVRRKLVREGETGVWVVALEAVVVERGRLRAEGGGVVQRLEAVQVAVTLQVRERCSGVEVSQAGVVRGDGRLVQVGQAVVEVEVGPRRVVLEAGEAGVVTRVVVGEEVGEAGVEVGGRRVLEGRVGRGREGARGRHGARARVEVRPRRVGVRTRVGKH